MKCNITNKEIPPGEGFKRVGNSVVSTGGIASLPPDMRCSPFLELILETHIVPRIGLWLLVEQAVPSWYPIPKYVTVEKYIWCIRPAFSGDAKFHVFGDGKYLWTKSNADCVFIDHRWALDHPPLKAAAKKLDLTQPPSFLGVWVVTESDTQAGVSNTGRNGQIQSVAEAVNEINNVMRPEFRYHIIENGRYIITFSR